jgi:hypothetical protein
MAINTNPGSPLRHVTTFTSSGTFRVPDGTTIAFASVHGASGGGGSGANNTQRYGGTFGRAGGAGVIASGFVQVTPGRDHVVTIGAGGGAGSTGGTSTFDSAITVFGGTGGSQSGAGSTGSSSIVTALTTVPPSANTLTRVFGSTTQATGGAAGGAGGAGNSAPHSGSGQSGFSGTSGIIHVYL